MCRKIYLDFCNTQLSGYLTSWLCEVYNFDYHLFYTLYFYLFIIILVNNEQFYRTFIKEKKINIHCVKLTFSPHIFPSTYHCHWCWIVSRNNGTLPSFKMGKFFTSFRILDVAAVQTRAGKKCDLIATWLACFVNKQINKLINDKTINKLTRIYQVPTYFGLS